MDEFVSIRVKYPVIVSVSRRCDIPRFKFDWFMERLDAGFVDVANPFNAGQIRRVSLLPFKDGMQPDECAEIFVFWTRDPRNILANTDELAKRGFPFYVMVSVTGYPAELEPNMAAAAEVLAAMKELVRKIGADRVIWRYDPILVTSITNEDFHRGNFNAIAQELSGSVKRVIISLYDEYGGAKQRIERLEKSGVLKMDSGADITRLLSGFAKNAEAAGMEIQSCAEKEDYSSLGIKKGACIDAELINKLFGISPGGKDKNQRPHCLCCKSVDIGAYRTCEARCVYCYAL
jgi:hypothetical protein